MSNKYLLPCACGQAVAVEISQAGQQVACACGNKLAVPSMRAIRQLPVATEPSAVRRSPGVTWNPAKGALFAIGLLLAIGGVTTAAYSYSGYRSAKAFTPSVRAYDESIAAIDGFTPTELLDIWHLITEHGLEPADQSPFVQAAEFATQKIRMVYVGLILAASGLLCALVPTLLGGK